ncbi:MAG: hypothetical protein K2J04_00970, partial [Lachnospiraceae bacterium]|nr:hypothetical protein [Lachnospiraceae bacterium]
QNSRAAAPRPRPPGPDGVQFDENGNYIELFYWNGENEDAKWWSGEEMSEEEYNARLNSVYPTEQAVKPEKYYSMKDICAILRTGEV